MSTAIPHQDGVEVFVNEGGAITIQQENAIDGISFIVIQPVNINALIRALREAKNSIRNQEVDRA